MKAAMQKLRRFRHKLKKIAKPLKKLGGMFAKFAAIGGAAILGVILIVAKLTSKVVDLGDKFDKMSKRTGIAVESLSAYKHALELSGTSLETFEKGVKRMSTFLLDGERGMKTSTDTLSELGLTMQEMANLTPEQKFEKLATAIAAIKDPTKRAALAQKVFGKAGTELLPMLSAGADGINKMKAEAMDLGLVMGSDATKKLADFKDESTRLSGAISGIVNDAVLMFIDTFGAYITKAKDKIVEMRKSGKLYEYIAAVAIKVLEFGAGFVKIMNTIKTYGNAIGTIFKNSWLLVFERIQEKICSVVLVGVNGVNKLIDGLNKIPKVNIGKVDTDSIKMWRDMSKDNADAAEKILANNPLKKAGEQVAAFNKKTDDGIKNAKSKIKDWSLKKKEKQVENNKKADELRNKPAAVTAPQNVALNDTSTKKEKLQNAVQKKVDLSDSLSKIGVNVSGQLGNNTQNLSKKRNSLLEQLTTGMEKIHKKISNSPDATKGAFG